MGQIRRRFKVEFKAEVSAADRVGRTSCETTRIYVLSVKPSVRRWNVWPVAKQVNAGYKEIADNDPLVYYVDVATPFLNSDGSAMTDIFVEDNLHLNDLGNSIWGATIKAALMPMEVSLRHSPAVWNSFSVR